MKQLNNTEKSTIKFSVLFLRSPSITYKDYTFPTYDMVVRTNSQSKSITLSGYTVIGGGLVSSTCTAPPQYKTLTFSASVSATTATWSVYCDNSQDIGTVYANSQLVRVWYYKN